MHVKFYNTYVARLLIIIDQKINIIQYNQVFKDPEHSDTNPVIAINKDLDPGPGSFLCDDLGSISSCLRQKF